MKRIVKNPTFIIVTGVFILAIIGVFYARETVVHVNYSAGAIPKIKRTWGVDEIEINQSGLVMIWGYDNALSARPYLNYDSVSVGGSSINEIYLDIENGVVKRAECSGDNPDINDYLNEKLLRSWRERKKYEDFISNVSLRIRIRGDGRLEFTYRELSVDQPPNPDLMCYAIPREGLEAKYLFPLSPEYHTMDHLINTENSKTETILNQYHLKEVAFKRRLEAMLEQFTRN